MDNPFVWKQHEDLEDKYFLQSFRIKSCFCQNNLYECE